MIIISSDRMLVALNANILEMILKITITSSVYIILYIRACDIFEQFSNRSL